MLGNRSRDTRPELALRSCLHSMGLRYRVGARPEASIRRTADVVFPRPKVAVFVDGCFWHACPEHGPKPKKNVDYWGPKLQANRERDADTDARLTALGWKVVRVWEHEAVERAAARVATAVAARVGQ
jgi:DNA mismatch endonuclease, patch repair protein